jgi:amino acid transporter
MNVVAEGAEEGTSAPGGLQRTLTWRDAFWVACGVPAYLLFSIGAIAATVGQPAWLVWVLSVLMGFVQAFTYAEIAGLFPNKSGGASVYGAIAWIRYSKFLAPVTVWCNWFAWAPVLSLGAGLASNYLLMLLYPPGAAIHHWSITLLDLSLVQPGLRLRISAGSLIAVVVLLVCYVLQLRGASQAARTQAILGVAGLLPLLIISIVPLITGDVSTSNLLPLIPLAHDSAGHIQFGSWNAEGWTLMLGGMFIAGYSTYGFETAICYTGEFRDPRRDTVRAILYSGVLCIAVYSLVPLAFQGHFGLSALLDPSIYDGSGVGAAMAQMVNGGAWISHLIVVMLVLTWVMSVTTAMMGSARTLYQASVDGWFPRYLSHVSARGVPTRALWTNLIFNLLLLLLSDSVAVVALANVGYIIFNFLNLQSGWIHRMDRARQDRPFRCPTWLLAAGSVFGFFNLAFMGIGADLWGRHTLRNGLIFAAVIVPIFAYRHYVQDKGLFPGTLDNELSAAGEHPARGAAGYRPYLAIALGCAVVWFAHRFSHLPPQL